MYKCPHCNGLTYFRLINDNDVQYIACVCLGPVNNQHELNGLQNKLKRFEKLENVTATGFTVENREIQYIDNVESKDIKTT